MTRDEFINHEVNVWGMDEVFAMLDMGYEPTELTTNTGQTKWTWLMPRLTNASDSATLNQSGSSAFLPFRGSAR